jgi:hypothetical protein
VQLDAKVSEYLAIGLTRAGTAGKRPKAVNANDDVVRAERGGERRQRRGQTMAPAQSSGGGGGGGKRKGARPPRPDATALDGFAAGDSPGSRKQQQQAYAEFETLLAEQNEGRAPRPDLPQPARDTKRAIDFTRLRNMQ